MHENVRFKEVLVQFLSLLLFLTTDPCYLFYNGTHLFIYKGCLKSKVRFCSYC